MDKLRPAIPGFARLARLRHPSRRDREAGAVKLRVAALEAGHNRDYQIVKFPGLNHLFQTAKTGSPQEYATIKETISPAVLETVSNFIQRHEKQ